jgi:hypothetical protein
MTHRITHHQTTCGNTEDQEQNPQEQVENISHALATGCYDELLVARTRRTEELQQQEIKRED